LTRTWSLSHAYEQQQIKENKTITSLLLVILMVMAFCWCNTMHIAQLRTFWGTLEAPGCHHWVTILIVFFRRLPESSITVHKKEGCGGGNRSPEASSKKTQNRLSISSSKQQAV
jgi:hypothetical protein